MTHAGAWPWGRSWLVLAALLVVGCVGAAPLPPRALELNQAGAEALAAGDLETADARLSLALEYHPRFVDALVNLGLVELQRGNFSRARRLLARARRYNQDVAQPHHGLGVLAEREGDPRRALGHYRDALNIDPGFYPARANAARLLFAVGLVGDSLLQHRRLMEAAPEQPEGSVGLVECLLRLGRVAEADAELAVALERFPGHPAFELLAARQALRQGQPRQALERLAPLVQRHDELTPTALAWSAAAALALERPEEAALLLTRALELDPAEPAARALWSRLALSTEARGLAPQGDPAP